MTEESNPKVVILQPLYGTVFPYAAISSTAMVVHSLHEGIDVDVQQSGMAYIDVARNGLARWAVGSNADWTMWLDQDQCVPKDALLRLLDHAISKELDVIGGLYFKKVAPYDPVPWTWAGERVIRPFYAFEHDCLQPVDGMGMGCTLVKTDVFKRMKKHFGDEWWFLQNLEQGEDVWFFDRLLQMGIQSYLDSSIQCGHVGDQVIHMGNFVGYFKLGLREKTLCLQHGWHEDTPGHCPTCEGSEESGHGTSAA